MSRRSIAAVLLVLALLCAGHAFSLLFEYRGYAAADAGPAAPSREWPRTRELARTSACPEAIVDLLEQAAAADDLARRQSRAATNRLVSELRAQAIYSAAFAIVLLVLGVLARRGSQMRPAP